MEKEQQRRMLSAHQVTYTLMIDNPFNVVALLAHNYRFSSRKPNAQWIEK